MTKAKISPRSNDEPPGFAAMLNGYGDLLLGALIVDPSRIHDENVAKLQVTDCPSELLQRVVVTLRYKADIDERALAGACVVGYGYSCRAELVNATAHAVPYLAGWYAANIRRLQRSRRLFWKYARKTEEARLKMLRDF